MKQHYYFKKIIIGVFFASTFFSCDNTLNDSDARQIMAKDEILGRLHKVSSFDITGFNEDTVKNPIDTNFKKVIRYTLDITYVDSNKVLQNKTGIVFFTPDGKSIINSRITNR
ncbi:MAG: hypothetical protein Q8891_01915 [Bacteroidota bacterium]|nr:hypothetical protein [Bacteroidota bacterium]